MLPIEAVLCWGGIDAQTENNIYASERTYGAVNNIFSKPSVYAAGAGMNYSVWVKSIDGESLDDYTVVEPVFNYYKPAITTSIYNDEELQFEDGYAIITDLPGNKIYHSWLANENEESVNYEGVISGYSSIKRIGNGVYFERPLNGAGNLTYGNIFTSSGDFLTTSNISPTEFVNGSAVIGDELWIDKREVPILYNGNFIETDEVARIVNNKTMIPLRVISEALDFEVEWIEDTQAIAVTKADKSFITNIGSEQAVVNGVSTILETAPYIHNDRTFIPLRDVSEALGFNVEWKEKWNMVIIN